MSKYENVSTDEMSGATQLLLRQALGSVLQALSTALVMLEARNALEENHSVPEWVWCEMKGLRCRLEELVHRLEETE